MLLAFAKKLRQNVTQVDAATGGPPVGSLTLIELYPQLRYGDIDGIGQVTIDGVGNMVGFSPVLQCQDRHGEIAWIPTSLVRNLRLSPVAMTPATDRAATPNGGGTATRTRRRRTRTTTAAAA